MTKIEIIRFFENLPENSIVYIDKTGCNCEMCKRGYGYFDYFERLSDDNVDIHIRNSKNSRASFSYVINLEFPAGIDIKKTIEENTVQKQLSLFDKI